MPERNPPLRPFTRRKSQSILSLGERSLLQKIQEWLGDASPPSPGGMGDDCAILPPSHPPNNLITVDSLVLDRHFEASAPPSAVGAKLLKRNLSDIAAMGGIPTVAVVALLLPGNLKIDWLSRFYRGLRDAAEKWEISIRGGDLSQSIDTLACFLTLLGQSRRPLRRRGAKVLDYLFVTGSLGGSILGKHLAFTPRLKEGQWLARKEGVQSMIDLTDGLCKDAPELASRGCRVALDPSAIPISKAAETLSRSTSRSSLEHALNDGEDYELLFALSSRSDPERFLEEWGQSFQTPLALIGKFVASMGEEDERTLLNLDTGLPLSPDRGYQHFSG